MTKEEVIQHIKDWNLDNDKMEVLSVIIPELKESEDEKIRKQLLNWFKDCNWDAIDNGTLKRDDIISWLKKQGEPKSADTPVDNVEPKFKVGDWVVRDYINSHDISRVTEVKQLDNEIFGYTLDNGTYFSGPWQESYHLWTIQDARKGDILQANKCTLIFDSLTKDIDDNIVISSWYYCDTKTFYGMGISQSDLWIIEGVVPATKEQRDLLFQKMKEAGYEWDAEKKELKKIERKPVVIIPKFHEGDVIKPKDGGHEPWKIMQVDISDKKYRFKDGYVIHFSQENDYELVEQKPTWSEEDKENISMLIDLVESKEESMEVKIELSAWLKSLKERVQPQPKWSEKDEERYVSCLQRLGTGNLKQPETINTVWLKSLKERMQLV